MASRSSLLSVLDELDTAAFGAAVLSKLNAQAVASLSLACKRFRIVCLGTRQSLKLGSARSAEAPIIFCPERFPFCSAVSFTIRTTQGATFQFPSLLPSLARLPRLTILNLDVPSPEAGNPGTMALLLNLVCCQLPHLQHLKLSVNSTWTDNSDAWQALGRSATQLHSLDIHFGVIDGALPLTLDHLSVLGQLSKLKSLAVQLCQVFAEQPQAANFFSSMTGLQHLTLPLAGTVGLHNISCCTNLLSLELYDGCDGHIQEDEYNALSKLVQLTSLRLGLMGGGTSDNPHMLALMQALPRLQVLMSNTMEQQKLEHSFLTALQGLTSLTELAWHWPSNGEWESSPATQHMPCISVRKFTGSPGIPFSSFPNLQEVQQWCSWPPKVVIEVASQCKLLKSLGVDVGHFNPYGGCAPTMSSWYPISERVSAIRALGGLKHLRHLVFVPNNDDELAALGASLSQLHCLSIWLPIYEEGRCTFQGFMHVMLLRQLQSLELKLGSIHMLDFTQEQVQCWIAGVHFVPKVCVLVSTSLQRDKVLVALAAAKAAGLQVPEEFSVELATY